MSDSTARNVLIVDDHSLFRYGVRRLLEEDGRFTVVAEAASGDEALRKIENHRPRLMLLDTHLPGISGFQIAKLARKTFPDLKVVLVSMHINDECLYHALRAGVYGLLTKEIGSTELLSALERVVEGARIIDDLVLQRPDQVVAALRGIRDERRAGRVGQHTVPEVLTRPLSARETQVLDHVARGLTNREISEVLVISEQTVKNHMSSVLRKLAVDGRLQAVVRALRHGWIQLDTANYTEWAAD